MKNNSKYKDVEIVDDYSMIQVELKIVSWDIPYSLDLYIKNISSKTLAVPNYCFNIFHEYHNVLTNEYIVNIPNLVNSFNFDEYKYQELQI